MGERFVAEVSSLLEGSARDRARLCEELAAHLEDARARGLDEAQALAQLGTPESIAAAWNARCARRRTQQRLRAASVAGVAAAASLLAVVQYAQGAPAHKAPPSTTTTAHPHPHRR